MKFRRTHRLRSTLPDAAPWAVVMFLMLFFALERAPGLTVELPAAGGPSAISLSGPSVAVALAAGGVFYLHNRKLAADELRAELKTLPDLHQTTVVLLVDRSVPYDRVLQIAQLARAAGVKSVVLGTRPALFPARQP